MFWRGGTASVSRSTGRGVRLYSWTWRKTNSFGSAVLHAVHSSASLIGLGEIAGSALRFSAPPCPDRDVGAGVSSCGAPASQNLSSELVQVDVRVELLESIQHVVEALEHGGQPDPSPFVAE